MYEYIFAPASICLSNFFFKRRISSNVRYDKHVNDNAPCAYKNHFVKTKSSVNNLMSEEIDTCFQL